MLRRDFEPRGAALDQERGRPFALPSAASVRASTVKTSAIGALVM